MARPYPVFFEGICGPFIWEQFGLYWWTIITRGLQIPKYGNILKKQTKTKQQQQQKWRKIALVSAFVTWGLSLMTVQHAKTIEWKRNKSRYTEVKMGSEIVRSSRTLPYFGRFRRTAKCGKFTGPEKEFDVKRPMFEPIRKMYFTQTNCGSENS